MASQAEPMDTADGVAERSGITDHGAASGEPIASEADLLAFTRLPLEERLLNAQLRGVLAESALTGRIRYKWPLLRPLIDFALEQVLTDYDAETRVEVGPPGPDSVSETIERFQKLLSAFSDAPWTFQRLCEILLEPKRQYARLPKLVLAIEKCLLVTTEQPPTDPDQLPAPPLCSVLGPVNVNPPPVYTNTHHPGSHGGHVASTSGGTDDSAAFTNSLLDLRHHAHNHHVGNHVGTPEHIEEDHWPEGLSEGKGTFKASGVGVGLHGALRPGAGGPGAGGIAGLGGAGGLHHGGSTAGTSDSSNSAGSGAVGLAEHDMHAHGCGRQADSGLSGTGGPDSPGAAAGAGGGERVGEGGAANHAGSGDSATISGAWNSAASTSVASAALAPHSHEPSPCNERQPSDSNGPGDTREHVAGDALHAASGSDRTLPPAAAGGTADADGDVTMEPVQEPAPSGVRVADAGQKGQGEALLCAAAMDGVAGVGGVTLITVGSAAGQVLHVTAADLGG